MQSDKALQDLKDVKTVFEKYNVPFFLTYGTCLGAIRDKDFIEHDDDIDLGVVAHIDLKTRKEIGWLLYDLGFKPQEVMFNVFGRWENTEQGYNGTEESGIIVCEREVKFTIFFFTREHCKECELEEYRCYPRLGAPILISTPSKFYNKLKEIKFHGEKFLVPDPVEDYLTWVYNDWKDPMGRDHGKLHFESHTNGQMLEDIGSSQRVVIKDSRPE